MPAGLASLQSVEYVDWLLLEHWASDFTIIVLRSVQGSIPYRALVFGSGMGICDPTNSMRRPLLVSLSEADPSCRTLDISPDNSHVCPSAMHRTALKARVLAAIP